MHPNDYDVGSTGGAAVHLRLSGTLGPRHLCNPGYAAFGVLGSGCTSGTAPVFSIAISVMVNTRL